MTQEEYGKLFGEHERYRQQIQGELAMLHVSIFIYNPFHSTSLEKNFFLAVRLFQM